MEPVHPLRELFAELAADAVPQRSGPGEDPSGLLARYGYGDLPDELLTEAIVNYAASAPVEVAEQLAPFVVAHSAVPSRPDRELPEIDSERVASTVGHGLALLSGVTAPPADDPHGGYGHDPAALDAGLHDPLVAHDPAGLDAGLDVSAGPGGAPHAATHDLDFGHGSAAATTATADAGDVGTPVSADLSRLWRTQPDPGHPLGLPGHELPGSEISGVEISGYEPEGNDPVVTDLEDHIAAVPDDGGVADAGHEYPPSGDLPHSS
jgi:hypothetical protein